MKILITEDDVMLADFLEEAVMELGHTVCGVAGNVAEAVELARLHQPDVAVLDMQLAGAELGSDVVEQLAASGDLGNIGILYVTGEAENPCGGDRMGHACLRKPYSLQTLEAALTMVRDLAIECRTTQRVPRGMGLEGQTDPTLLQPRIASAGAVVIRNGRGTLQGAPHVAAKAHQPATY